MGQAAGLAAGTQTAALIGMAWAQAAKVGVTVAFLAPPACTELVLPADRVNGAKMRRAAAVRAEPPWHIWRALLITLIQFAHPPRLELGLLQILLVPWAPQVKRT